MSKYIQSITVVVVFILICFTGRAGTGTISGKTADISVMFLFQDVDVQTWSNTFNEASMRLFDATERNLQLGMVRFFIGRKPKFDADVYIRPGTNGGFAYVASMGSSSKGRGIYLSRGNHMAVDQGRFSFVHEWGHYAFNLRDEYFGYRMDAHGNRQRIEYEGSLPADNFSCISENDAHSCIMDGGISNNIQRHEFCWSGNHVGEVVAGGFTNRNAQEDTHGESCWDTIVGYVNQQYGLNWTAPTKDPLSDTTGHNDIFVDVIQDIERLVLCIDQSGSMIGDKIDQAKIGARLFIDLADIGDADIAPGIASVPAPGEKVGIISFTLSAVERFGLAEMTDEAAKTLAQNAVNTLSANGGTGIGAGLNSSLQMLQNAGPQVAGIGEHIILLSDGVSGDDPSPAVAGLKARGVPVYTIGLGDDVDEEVMLNIASETGGSYFFVANAVDLADAFLKIKQEVRSAHSAASWTDTIVQDAVTTIKMTIDSYTTIARWILSWQGSDLDIELESPSGVVISGARASDVVEFIERDTYEIVVLRDPEPGEWIVRVIGVDVSGEEPFTLDVFGESASMMVALDSDKINYIFPEKIHLCCTVIAEIPVIGANVMGKATRPDGTTVPVTLCDDGLAKNGDSISNDGVYSCLFDSYSGDGNYVFEVSVVNVNGTGPLADSIEIELEQGYETESVKPFTRTLYKTVAVSGVPVFINVTPYSSTDFATWQVDRNTGAMMGSMIVRNLPDSFKTLSEPFWYVLDESQNVRLYQVDGYINNLPYTNITRKVNRALQAKYGRQTMLPGEWVAIEEMRIWSRDRSIPQLSELWSLYADPPGQRPENVHSYDFNRDRLIQDEEVLKGVNDWYHNDLDDFDLLRLIELWKVRSE